MAWAALPSTGSVTIPSTQIGNLINDCSITNDSLVYFSPREMKFLREMLEKFIKEEHPEELL